MASFVPYFLPIMDSSKAILVFICIALNCLPSVSFLAGTPHAISFHLVPSSNAVIFHSFATTLYCWANPSMYYYTLFSAITFIQMMVGAL